MKIVASLVLFVVAIVAADEGFYQPQQYQSAPSAQGAYSNYNNYNNYYDYQPAKQQGLWDRISNGIRRQGLGGLLGGLGGLGAIGPIGIIVAAAVALAVVGALGFIVTQLNNSGRGLDNDDWEINHSVWMDQLSKDFEDSWSVE